MNTDLIKSAASGKYSEFSTLVKSELSKRLANHPEIQEYTRGVNKIHELKSAFDRITAGNL